MWKGYPSGLPTREATKTSFADKEIYGSAESIANAIMAQLAIVQDTSGRIRA